MGLELMQAKADVAKLQAEAKFKDEAFQSIIVSKDDQLRSKDAVIESKEQLLQAVMESKEQLLQAVMESKEQLLQMQAKDAEIRRLHADLARCGAAHQPAVAPAAPAPPLAPAPAHALLHFSSNAAHRAPDVVLSPDRLTVSRTSDF
jgi:hypothetical protein